MESNCSERPPELLELRRDVRVHIDAGLAAARHGRAVAQSTGDGASEQFFERCLSALERVQIEAQSMDAEPPDSSIPAPADEQVSDATFAPGDGANDAQVTPEKGRGKPGGWPTY